MKCTHLNDIYDGNCWPDVKEIMATHDARRVVRYNTGIDELSDAELE